MFYQPQTKWNAPQPTIDSFDQTVKRIQQHRLANPQAGLSTEWEDIEADLEAFTNARLHRPKPAVPYAPLPEKAKKKSGCRTCGDEHAN